MHIYYDFLKCSIEMLNPLLLVGVWEIKAYIFGW